MISPVSRHISKYIFINYFVRLSIDASKKELFVMTFTKNVMRMMGLSCLTFLMSCSSCGPPVEPAVTISNQIESGFDFLTDAFVFENFGGDAVGTQLDARLMARMFGEASVCRPSSDPCELTDVASLWMRSTNETLDTGRSEGFATLALLFHKGVLDPNDFGAATVAELSLLGNPALQDEFAYWAASQAVASAQTSSQRFEAKDVMAFLENALAPDAKGAWRLAIAQKTDIGFQRGHALVPMGYFKAEGGIYWLRIYDNNFPSEEQRLEINPEANTWRYVVTGLLGDDIVYEGNPENGNLLYFSNVLERTGVLQAPFSPDSDAFSIVTSGMTAVIEVGGEQTGLVDGKVVEYGDDRVIPAFSSCPLCGTPVNIVNQTLINKGVRSYDKIDIRSTGDYAVEVDGTQVDRRAKSITTSSNQHSTTVRPTGSTENDRVEFNADGGVRYESSGGDPITIESTVRNEDGSTSTIKVTVDPPDNAENFNIRVDQRDGSRSRFSVDNVPEGTNVTYEISKTKDGETEKSSVTFEADGDARVDYSDNEGAEVSGGTKVDSGTCDNGVLDPLTESDIDCGNICGPCRQGKTCRSDSDCGNGDCTNGTCRRPTCSNGTKDGSESGVDCGGTECALCTSANDDTAGVCASDSDCEADLCLAGRCRRRVPIKVVIPRLVPSSDTSFSIEYRLDGGESQTLDIRDFSTRTYPATIELGEGSSFAIDFAGSCRTEFGVEKSVAQTDTVTLDCPESGSQYLILKQDTAFRPAGDDPVKLRVTLDGVNSEVDYDGSKTTYLGTYTASWAVRVLAEPTQQKYGNLPAFDGNLYLACENFPKSSVVMGNGSFTSISKMSCVPQMNAPSCRDRRRNQNESDIDCGGVCGPCIDGATCNITRDCNTRECNTDFVCLGAAIDTCTDGRKNVGETDIDCGAFANGMEQCPRCALNQACENNGNCASGLGCESGVCLAFGCADARINGQETDVDCGGPDCSKCADSSMCAAPGDCVSGVCTGMTCAAPTCSDAVQNQSETAIDCGGPNCAGCADGFACAQDTDCTSGYCNGASLCAAPTCSDSDRNGQESDVDCGGPTCNGCAGGLSCTMNSDCASNNCTNNACVSMPTCSDLIQNQGETAVDCGGPNCSACAVGTACTMDTECASGSCECGSNSGNCAGASGKCSQGQYFLDQPVTDGTTASGTYTLPAGCTQLYVQAWGAGGGAADVMGFASMQGGGAGYIDGILSVTPGDTVTVWLGQGGKSGFNPGGAGSYLGTAANGGDGGFGMFGTDPGGGGGLTSVQITGTTPHSFSVPGGAGAEENGVFTTTVTTAGGGGGVGYEGAIGSNDQGGGGAGDPGGTENTPGAYGMLPAGLTAYDGDVANFEPGGTTNQDYARCLGTNMIAAGTSDAALGSGGDGCVVLRCVGQ